MTEIEKLAQRLCVGAGMIMEDVVDIAILNGGVDLADRASKIGAAGREIAALADAARALLKRA